MNRTNNETSTTITSAGSTIVFKPVEHFDVEKKQHIMCGVQTVVHCHHYATLFTQMANDAEHLDGPRHLVEAAADSFYPVLHRYISTRNIESISDRLAVAEQHYAFSGLGQVSFRCSNGEAVITMPHSHIDEGWLLRWGPRDKPVNFIGAGFIRAALAVAFDLPHWSSVEVEEKQSIVRGAEQSVFAANWEG